MPAPRQMLRLAALAGALGLSLAGPGHAQDLGGSRSVLFDLQIGAPVGDQPQDFQQFACGTNGGPASLPLTGFGDYALCPPEDETGLHEVTFQYGDEMGYRALALDVPAMVDRFSGTKIGESPVVVSALIDDCGVVRGLRAVTDDRASDRQRRRAYTLAGYLRSQLGEERLTCEDQPLTDGETAVGNRFVKQICTGTSEEGAAVTLRSSFFRKAGQVTVDAHTGQFTSGQYESRTVLEMISPERNASCPAPAEAPAADLPAEGPEAFAAGLTNDCPDCDLSGIRLLGRDLSGADLTGANLSGATLHRAILTEAKLDGANLSEANLNLANLFRASLRGADLSRALLYEADLSGADLTGAALDTSRAQQAHFRSAIMADVTWTWGVATEADLVSADLTRADLSFINLGGADLRRAGMTGANLTTASLFESRLDGAVLDGATLTDANLRNARLVDVSFAGADLSGAMMLRAYVPAGVLEGALLSGTEMADGRVSD
ncbi:pentapeptide repeat-containing protein [Pseudoroseicyclus sp. H15]